MDLNEYIRTIPDFPKEGIQFKDITTLLNHGSAYAEAIRRLVDYASAHRVDLIASPEARGFVVGAPLAVALSAGFVPIRKRGKLPYETIEVSYTLEYGQDSLTIHKDAIQPGQRVLLVDDLLATGGTIASCLQLVRELGAEVIGCAFLIELKELNGREKLKSCDVFSLIQY